MKEAGIYTPSGFESRDMIVHKLSLEENSVSVDRPNYESPSETFEQTLDRIDKIKSLDKSGIYKSEIDISVLTEGMPYFLYRPLSDMHIGAYGVNNEAVRENLHDIKDYPIYTSLVGDVGDFFGPAKHPEGMLGAVVQPTEQATMIRRFFDEYQDKILTTTHSPSHDGWSSALTGFDLTRYFVDKLNITPLLNGGIVHLKVNQIDYKILLFHKIARFNSSLNLTNAGKRMLDMYEDADIVIAGHTHIGALEKLIKRNSKATVVQLGTFKEFDTYGEVNGMVPHPKPFFPTIFFSGQHKNIEVIEDRCDATNFMDALLTLKKYHEINPKLATE